MVFHNGFPVVEDVEAYFKPFKQPQVCKFKCGSSPFALEDSHKIDLWKTPTFGQRSLGFFSINKILPLGKIVVLFSVERLLLFPLVLFLSRLVAGSFLFFGILLMSTCQVCPYYKPLLFQRPSNFLITYFRFYAKLHARSVSMDAVQNDFFGVDDQGGD